MASASAYEVARRRAHDAASRLSSAVVTVRHLSDTGSEPERWLAGYEAETLLWATLRHAEDLVPALLGEDDTIWGDEIRQALADLDRALKRRRRAGKLARVQGRTPEEAEAFRAKAAELAGGAA